MCRGHIMEEVFDGVCDDQSGEWEEGQGEVGWEFWEKLRVGVIGLLLRDLRGRRRVFSYVWDMCWVGCCRESGWRVSRRVRGVFLIGHGWWLHLKIGYMQVR